MSGFSVAGKILTKLCLLRLPLRPMSPTVESDPGLALLWIDPETFALLPSDGTFVGDLHMTGWSREELGERRGRGNGGRGRVPRPLRGSWVGGAEEMGRGAEGRYVGSNKVRHRGIGHGSHTRVTRARQSPWSQKIPLEPLEN